MEAKIIELQTERTIEQNLASIGTEYYNEISETNGHLPIYGAIDPDSKVMVLVIEESAHQSVMNFINQVNQRSQK